MSDFRDTENLMGRLKDSNLTSALEQAAKQKQIAIQQAQTQLKYYQQLNAEPSFQQFLKDLSDRTDAAFEAMDKATTDTELIKSAGEFIGVRRALKHTDERIAALSTFLEEQGVTLDE
jgi:hypothetical protein